MNFNSFAFFLFFAVVFSVYWTLRGVRARVTWLLLASALFYGSWNPYLLGLILFSAAFDYFVALRIEAAQSPRVRKALLILSLAMSLSLLAFFKYTNFLLGNAGMLAGWLGWHWRPPAVDIILPLGISFYTFETISYVVDVYRRRTRAVRNIRDYALYLMFFPHLISGPIVRPHEFLPQTGQAKRFDWDRLQYGAQLFLMGLFKKAVLADAVAPIAEQVFGRPGDHGTAAAWLAVLCYAVQIYCDFSGYSDMAVGTAHAFGFKLPANFNMPYFAAGIGEFWRRWHITLSTWLRDYLYIPLGGNRHGLARTCFNLMLTMLLGGLWHGAKWTFVFWGAYHGLLLVLQRLLPLPGWLASAALRPLKVACTFLLVCVGWVFFRSATFPDAWTLLARLFRPTAGAALSIGQQRLTLVVLGTVLLGHVAGTFLPLKRMERRAPALALGLAYGLAFLLIQVLMPEAGGAFIYFQF